MVEPTVVPELLRRIAMAGLMLIHIQFAAFLIGVFGLGVTMEFFGILVRHRPHFERLAHALARTAIIMYSTGAVIAIIFILLISLLWPTFWYIIMRINFWPMVLEGITFVLTILYLFPWYYTWDRLSRFKGVHVSLGLALVVVAQLQQSMIDVVAGYMLTPTPPDDLLRVFFNASAIPLDMHRIVGDVSFAGFVVGGYGAFRMLRTRDPEQRAYYDWVGNIGVIAGLGFLFLQPAIGLSYVEEIRANSPGAFTTMMRGRLSWTFLVQSAFLSGIFTLSVRYMGLQVSKSFPGTTGWLRALVVLCGLSGLLLIQPYVIGPSQENAWINWINPLGTMRPWKYLALAGLSLGSIGAILIYLSSLRKGLNWGSMEFGGRQAQMTLIVLAVLTSAMMAVMGYIRENARLPYLIYYERRVTETEQFPELTPTPESGLPSEGAADLESRPGENVP